MFTTPRAEVKTTTRLALAGYLRDSLGPRAEPAIQILVGTAGPGEPNAIQAVTSHDRFHDQREDWDAIRRCLEDVSVLDPACGGGEFLEGMLDLIDELGEHASRSQAENESRAVRRRRIAASNLFGVDVRADAVADAGCRLGCGPLTPNLLAGDSLVGGLEEQWEHRFPDIMARGGFDIVVGNPPYVRHEQIADPMSRMDSAAYRREAWAAVYRRHPSIFGWDEERGTAVYPLSGRSDLCLLFLFLALGIAQPRGVIGLVLPNSLFQAAYGETIETVLQQVRWSATVVESRVQRTFHDAGINTSLFLAGPPAQREERTILSRIETTGPLENAVASDIWQRGSISYSPCLPAADSMVRLGDLGRVRYAVKTGLNRFFYPDPQTVERFQISHDCLRPLLKSPRDVRTLAIDGHDAARGRAFVCRLSPSELKCPEHAGTQAYIEWGSRQRTARVPWPLMPSLRGRRLWYELPIPEPADILCARFFDCRFFFGVPMQLVIEDQTFYGLLLSARLRTDRDIVAAILNSSLTYWSLETHGRTGLGDGVRQYALRDMAALPVLSPDTVPASRRHDLLAAYQSLSQRPILPIQQEVTQPDRQELDAIIADITGLSDRDMATIRSDLLRRTQQRQTRARSASQPSLPAPAPPSPQ